MNIHEIEEQEVAESRFFFRNDHQVAFEASRREFESRDEGAKIDAALADGKIVIASHHPKFCPRTDALIGTITSLIRVFDTRAEAEAALAEYEEWEAYDLGLHILPDLPRPEVPVAVVEYADPDSNDIPF